MTPEVLKNTNTKIVHRLFAADDRHAIGDTIGLDDEQKEFLTLLNAGEAIVYSAGWHESVRVQVHTINDTNAPEIDVKLIAQAGADRVYKQRQRLYPNLSTCEDWESLGVDQFNQYVVNATKLLNQITRWVISPSQEWVDRIHTSLNKLQNNFLSISHQNALLMLFKDVAPVSSDVKYTDNLDAYELTNYLFALISRDQLPADPAKGSNFQIEHEKQREIWNDISLIFKNLKSI